MNSLIRVVPNVLFQTSAARCLSIVRIVRAPRILITEVCRLFKAVLLRRIEDRGEETLSVEKSDFHLRMQIDKVCHEAEEAMVVAEIKE